MKKSIKRIDENLLSEKREWKAFGIKRNPEGAWDLVEMSLPNQAVLKFKTKLNKQRQLGQIVNKIRTLIAQHAQRR